MSGKLNLEGDRAGALAGNCAPEGGKGKFMRNYYLSGPADKEAKITGETGSENIIVKETGS